MSASITAGDHGANAREALIDIKAARSAFEDAMRASILDAAAMVLRDEGPAAFTVRRIATAVNGSTKAIYTYFGSKDGLFDALYLKSFAGLGVRMRAALDAEPPERALWNVCHAYRDYAREHPTLYNLMFGDLGRAYEAPIASRRKAFETFVVLRLAVEACLPSDRQDEGRDIARQLWALMHGIVGLELRDLLTQHDDALDIFRDMLMTNFRALALPCLTSS